MLIFSIQASVSLAIAACKDSIVSFAGFSPFLIGLFEVEDADIPAGAFEAFSVDSVCEVFFIPIIYKIIFKVGSLSCILYYLILILLISALKFSL